MAKLVQKSGYIKSGKARGYMRYIATREGVEKLTGNSPVTRGQRELIQKLLHDFPDAVELFEYEDYCKTPTLGTASAFITMALDANLHEIDSESGYMQYIATRPRVQKRGAHGLFSSATAVDLASAMSELEAHEGNVWTIIYSLRREDAARLEYDSADAWRTLLMENAPALAKSMKISLNNFHWYAAFHDEGLFLEEALDAVLHAVHLVGTQTAGSLVHACQAGIDDGRGAAALTNDYIFGHEYLLLDPLP